MKGFDDKFADFPDYILGVTHEIWEERRIASLRRYYAPNLLVRSPASIVKGCDSVIAATLATQAEFPDRKLFGEDVIWCGTPEEGMLSSHRILCEATHLGRGAYGPPSGKQLRYRVMADCHVCGANQSTEAFPTDDDDPGYLRDIVDSPFRVTHVHQIDDEWLIRDQGAIVRQMGWDPKEYALNLIVSEGGPEKCVKPFHPNRDIAGPYNGRGNDNDWGARLGSILKRLMVGDVGVVAEEYDRACHFYGASGREGYSHDVVGRFWMELRSAFPSSTFSIDHLMGLDELRMPPRAAARWSLLGRHDGHGPFGPPTGAEVYVMGMTHVEFGPRGVRFECSLYDETAVWKQLLLANGDTAL